MIAITVNYLFLLLQNDRVVGGLLCILYDCLLMLLDSSNTLPILLGYTCKVVFTLTQIKKKIFHLLQYHAKHSLNKHDGEVVLRETFKISLPFHKTHMKVMMIDNSTIHLMVNGCVIWVWDGVSVLLIEESDVKHFKHLRDVTEVRVLGED
jgi:hypothetical protein